MRDTEARVPLTYTCAFCGAEFDPEEVPYVSTDRGEYHNPDCWALYLEERVRGLEEELAHLRRPTMRGGVEIPLDFGADRGFGRIYCKLDHGDMVKIAIDEASRTGASAMCRLPYATFVKLFRTIQRHRRAGKDRR